MFLALTVNIYHGKQPIMLTFQLPIIGIIMFLIIVAIQITLIGISELIMNVDI